MRALYPQRQVESDLYNLRDIIDMATRYPRKGFYEYHRQFSLMSASHLKFNNILVDWSVRHITGTFIFCKIFANAKVPACMYCQIHSIYQISVL